MIESICERSQILKEAVAIATGVDILDFLNGNTKQEQYMARRLAVDLYLQNFGFMGRGWIGNQLNYNGESIRDGGKQYNRFSPEVHEKAQALYDQMIKEAKQ